MKKNNKTEKILKLILFLCRQTESSKATIINTIECDERTFFNYLHDIRAVGFIIKCKAGKYSLIKKNDIYRVFQQLLNVNPEEDARINESLEKLHLDENKKKELLIRLAGHLQTPKNIDIPTSTLKKNMRRAIHECKQVIIHEHTIKGGLPKSFIADLYSIDNNNEHCWIYIATMDKNIKIRVSDILNISISPIHCLYKSKHLKIINDVLGNYGISNCETSITITKLGAKRLMSIYPATNIFIKKIENTNNFIFKTQLCEYNSIIEFILFHPDFIININSTQLKEAIQEWFSYTQRKFSLSTELIEY